MLCPEAVLLGQTETHGVAASLSCKRWTCDRCRPLNSAKLAQLIRDLNPAIFITLTDTPHHGASPDERARRLRTEWRRLCRLIRRWIGSKIDYIAVLEATERGEPHVHIAVAGCRVRPHILQRKLKEWLGAARTSRRIRVQRVNNLDGLARYMSKDPHKFDGCKRFCSSLGWRAARTAFDAAFTVIEIIMAPLHAVERRLLREGATVIARSRRSLAFHPP